MSRGRIILIMICVACFVTLPLALFFTDAMLAPIPSSKLGSYVLVLICAVMSTLLSTWVVLGLSGRKAFGALAGAATVIVAWFVFCVSHGLLAEVLGASGALQTALGLMILGAVFPPVWLLVGVGALAGAVIKNISP